MSFGFGFIVPFGINQGFSMADQDNKLFNCNSFLFKNANGLDLDELANPNLLMEPKMLDNLKLVQIDRSIQIALKVMVIKVNKRITLNITSIIETRFRNRLFLDSLLN